MPGRSGIRGGTAGCAYCAYVPVGRLQHKSLLLQIITADHPNKSIWDTLLTQSFKKSNKFICNFLSNSADIQTDKTANRNTQKTMHTSQASYAVLTVTEFLSSQTTSAAHNRHLL